MKEFLEKTFYHNTIQDWFIALAIMVGAFILAKICYWIFGSIIKKLTAKTETEFDDIVVDKLEEPLSVMIAIFGSWYALNTLTLGASNGGQVYVDKAIYFILSLNIAWIIARLANAFFDKVLRPMADQSETDLDDAVLPIIQKGTRFIIWAMAIIIGLDNAGYDIGAVLAGLGIGGLALAMAAKDTVSNVFGGITVFIDKPFKINDRVKIGGYDGNIVEIGLRVSRLQTLEGRIVSIPNSKFTDSFVENVSLEPNRKVVLNLGLTYDTAPEDMELGMKILKDILTSTDLIEEKHVIGFNNFGDFSLGILVVYYIKKSSDIIGTQTQINLEILKQFNQNKLDFAFPTQSILAKIEKE